MSNVNHLARRLCAADPGYYGLVQSISHLMEHYGRGLMFEAVLLACELHDDRMTEKLGNDAIRKAIAVTREKAPRTDF